MPYFVVRVPTRARRRRTGGAAFLLVTLLGSAAPAAGQVNALQVNLSVPTPVPYLAQWSTTPSAAVMTVTNSAGVDLDVMVTARFLKDDMEVGTAPGRITRLAGERLDTAGFIPVPRVQVFTAPAIADWRQARFVGAVADRVSRTGRLPDGEYSLCVRFENVTPVSSTPRAVEDTEQCAWFRIGSPQPPTLLLPRDAADVLQRNPVFAWTPVVDPGVASVVYRLRVVEVLPGQTPTRAIEANRPVFETAVTSLTSVPYPPSAFPLEVGTRYAWRVRSFGAGAASDPDFAGPGAPLGENEGRSEVFTFTRKAQLAILPGAIGRPKGPTAVAGSPFFNRMVRGRLMYSFDRKDVPTPKRVQLPVTTLPMFTLMGQPTGPENPLGGLGPQGFTQPRGGSPPPPPPPAPLEGVTVRLVVRYRTAKEWLNFGTVHVGGRSYDRVGHVVGSGTTDSEGRFVIAFHDDLPTGLLGRSGEPIRTGSGDVVRTMDGPVARFYQLEVSDPHYLSPSDEIVVGEADPGDLGTLVSLVRSYRLRVHVLDRLTRNPPAAGEYAVTIGRENRPAGVPENEGEGPRATLGTYSRIAQKKAAGRHVLEFDRLVRNIGPADRYRIGFSVPEGSEANYRTASTTYANGWYRTLQGGPNAEATYNEDYDFDLVGEDTLWVTPLPPRYIGRVIDAETQEPVEKALLVLIDATRIARGLRRIVPSDSGRFVWDIPDESGAEWTLDVASPGYEVTTVAVPTTRGYRRTQDIPVRPAARLVGHVQAPDGSAVPARVWFGPAGTSLVAETEWRAVAGGGAGGGRPGAVAASRIERVAEGFDFRVPARTDTLHVDPTEGGFCGVAMQVRLRHGMNDVGAVTVQPENRRVAVKVLEGTGETRSLGAGFQLTLAGAGAAASPTPVRGAVVEAIDAYEADGVTRRSAVTGRDGVALLALGPGRERVSIRVRGPDNGDYQARSYSDVPTAACGGASSYTAYLAPASRVAGTVYRDGDPVRGARVAVDGRDGLETTTDGRGRYQLRNVPRGSARLIAALPNSGVLAQERELGVSEPAYDGVDFELESGATGALEWGRGLLGFTVALTDVTPRADGSYTVSGRLTDLPGNAAFRLADPRDLPFDSVTVRPGPDGTPVPVSGVVHVASTSLPLRLLDTYSVRQEDPDGLLVRAADGGAGAVVGAASLHEAPFLDVEFVDRAGKAVDPRLVPAGATGAGGSGDLATITADGTAPGGDAYGLAGDDGARLRFRLYDYDADAAPEDVTLDADGLLLRDATVHTAIPGVEDLALPAPGLRVTQASGVATLRVDHPIERPLQQWTLRTDGWLLDRGMARLTGGELVVPVDPGSGAGVNLPLASVSLAPDAFRSATFQNAPLRLGGLVALDVNARDLKFNRDGEDGPWRVYASTGARIPALPGMRPTDVIPLGLLRMQSDGELAITPESGTTVRLFDAADFRVGSIVPGERTLTLGGALDAAIPGVAPQTHSIIYRSSGSGLRFDMVPLDIGPVDIGGARLRIEDAVLDSAGLHGGGYVEVPGQFRVATDFRRTPPGRGNVVEAVPAAGATIDVGEIALGALEGGATARNGRWSTRFAGDLDVGGEVGGRLSFEVEDARVNVGTAGLDVKNIQTPFGQLSIVVNFPLERFEGSMDIDGYLTDGLYADGRAEMIVSGAPGNRYWHIYSGMGFRLDTPRLEGTAALLIGNTTLSGRLLADFNQYSVHGVPPDFYRIRGFFLEGQVSWPVPICPSGGFDIGVASVGISCNIRGDLRMGMNFLENDTYYLGALAGINVAANGQFGLGACVSLWGELDAWADLEGSYRSDGAWYALGRANMDLRGGASYGVGVDDYCLDYTKSFLIGLGAEAQLGHNWNTGEGRFVRVHFR